MRARAHHFVPRITRSKQWKSEKRKQLKKMDSSLNFFLVTVLAENQLALFIKLYSYIVTWIHYSFYFLFFTLSEMRIWQGPSPRIHAEAVMNIVLLFLVLTWRQGGHPPSIRSPGQPPLRAPAPTFSVRAGQAAASPPDVLPRGFHAAGMSLVGSLRVATLRCQVKSSTMSVPSDNGLEVPLS